MTYLTSHGKTYYFRLFVPTDLQRVLGRKVIKKSLKTGNKRTALRLALKIQSAIHPYLQAITENTIMIDPHRLKECLNSYFHKIIDNDESMRAYPSLKPLTISDLGDKDIQFDTNIQFVDAKSPKQSTGRFINKEIDYLKHENEHIENNIEYIDDIIASQFCCKNDDRRTLSRIILTEKIHRY